MAVDLSKAALSGVASKVSESMFDSGCFYVFKYLSYIGDLKKLVEDLINARERVEHFVDFARRRGEETGQDIEQWLIKVNECIEGEGKCIIDEEKKAKKCCFQGLCANIMRQYLLGKKAVKAGKNAVNFLGKRVFDTVSYCSLQQRREYMYVRDFKPFDCRMSKCHDITEALNDTNIDMIEEYGMGGVGKTILVKVVAWQVMEKKLLNTIDMVEETKTSNHNSIKKKNCLLLGLITCEVGELKRVCDYVIG